MPVKKLLLVILILGLFGVSCTKEDPGYTEQSAIDQAGYSVDALSAPGFPENFESGSKGAYAAADVVLTTGTWNLADALIGSTTSDRKNGSKSVRIQNSGKVTMKFNTSNGASAVSIYYAKYGTDASSTFQLWYSTNSGSTWTQTGSTITASTTTLTKVTFNTSLSGTVRFEIRKTGGGRLNIDDLDIQDNAAPPAAEDNMAMGNPSGAVTNSAYPIIT